MDIASLSTSLATSQLQTSVGVSMLSKSMDTAKMEGDGIAAMINSVPKQQMELSVNPNIGSLFDMSV